MKSEGVCNFCKKIFSAGVMLKHLQSCPERIKAKEKEDKNKKEKIFLMRARTGPFFLYFEMNASSKLKDIDDFLRETWLECCGHLSAFTIAGSQYCSSPQREYGDRNMNIQLDNVISPGMKFIHEYDFGTTTHLDMACISERLGSIKGIKVAARNNPPDFSCCNCGKPAKEICSECIWEGKGLLCEKCAKDHECGEDMLLPVVNSPRMGMCGYTG